MDRRRRKPGSDKPGSGRDEPTLPRRLDLAMVEQGLVDSRELARALIMAGDVSVDGKPARRAAEPVGQASVLSIRAAPPFVSRGGYKLTHALDRFSFSPRGKIAVDVGASTGGFTDVLLQRGAARVYAVDVGYGQLDFNLRSDPRVVVLDRTNIRSLLALPEQCHLATIDVSFISLRVVIPPVLPLLVEDWDIIALVKPQFEAGRGQVPRGGVVRDPALHREILVGLGQWSMQQGMIWNGLTASPIRGAAGNIEFLAWLKPAAGSTFDLLGLVSEALSETSIELPGRASE